MYIIVISLPQTYSILFKKKIDYYYLTVFNLYKVFYLSRSINFDLPLYKAGEELLFLHEDKIRFMQDIFFFIHHEAMSIVEPILDEYRIGLAHFRLMQFICHYPGISVGELCSMLGITKQSLNRVLRETLEQDFVYFQQTPADRRKKVLFLTKKGKKLEEELFSLQRKQFVRAFREVSNNTYIEGFQRILYGMISKKSKKMLENLTIRKIKDKNNVGK